MGTGRGTCGNLADEIPTSPHPSSSQYDGDDLNFHSPGNCPNNRVHLMAQRRVTVANVREIIDSGEVIRQ